MTSSYTQSQGQGTQGNPPLSQRITAKEAQQKAQAESEFRSAARARLIPFCQYLWRGFEARPHRQLIAAALELCESGVIKRLMIFTPPQYGKSELVSRSFPAWYLGRNPDKQMILASYGETLAFNLSTDSRSKIMDPAYRNLFGDLSIYKRAVSLSKTSKSVREWRIGGHRGRLKSAGVGGGITGHPADFFLIDDPVKDMEAANSILIREKTISWYKTSALTRLSPVGCMVICMTRWHEGDLAGYLLRLQHEPGADKWFVLRLPARAEGPEEIAAWAKRNFVPPERMIVADRPVRWAA